MKVSLTLQLYIQCSFPPNKSKAFSLMVFQKGDEKLSFCTPLQIQYTKKTYELCIEYTILKKIRTHTVR